MSRILLIGNAPWVGSGYGEQLATFAPRFQALGHDVAIFCNYGMSEGTTNWNGIPVYPQDNGHGNKAIGTWRREHNADVIIALCDAFIMEPQEWPDDVEVAIWAPVDHDPLIPAPVLAVLSHDKVRPIAMSQFGHKVMAAGGLEPLYVPHGIDTGVFYPRRDIRDEVRDTLGIPRDAFLAGMVAANKSASPSRKGFHPAFHAFAEFSKEHDDAWLYVHSQRNGIGGGSLGEDLELLVTAVGLVSGQDISERVRFPEQRIWDLGMPSATVAALYQAFDVLLMPSMGEGFGVPLIEAQACGVPVISSAHSAMTELAQAGWLVTGDPYWDKWAASFLIMPSIVSIKTALEAAYEAREDMELRAAAAEFALQYDADLVTEKYWRPALEQLAPFRPESRQVRRARERKALKVAV